MEVQAVSLLPLPVWSASAIATAQAAELVFFKGTVEGGQPAFVQGAAVDHQRKFAYAIRHSTGEEGGPVARIDLTTGRIDDLPVFASSGIYLRPSDGSLFFVQ